MSDAVVSLQLDVGNSGAKWRLVSGDAVLDRGRYPDALPEPGAAVGQVLVSSVASASAEESLASTLRERYGVEPWFARTEARSGDLVNSYGDPARMGVDRWLAMLGARARHCGRLCVVDAGSALTIDLVGADGVHEGGFIVPGVDLMERALLLDTDRVRFDEDIDYALTPGRSTAEAVRHGIALASTGAVATALDRSGGESPALFFCGGGGRRLMAFLDRGGDWVPDLVFEGLEVMAAARA